MDDKSWLLKRMPTATESQIYRFIERVGIKLDHAGCDGIDVARARKEALSGIESEYLEKRGV